jgi:hypothetical protein
MAIHYAAEGRALATVKLSGELSLTELETQLAQPANAVKTRELYAQAYQAVRSLMRQGGAPAAWRRVTAR